MPSTLSPPMIEKKKKKAATILEAGYIISEIGKSISAANTKKVKDALAAMKAAMEVIAPLIADDADEEVKEVTSTVVDIEQPNELREMYTIINKWEKVNLNEAAKILAQSDSYDSIRNTVSRALRKREMQKAVTAKASAGVEDYYDYYDYGSMPYIRDMYDAYVVYSVGKTLYQCDYTITKDDVVLGAETEVQVSYVPITTNTTEKQSVQIEFKGDIIKLQEKAVKDDGTARVKLISPGRGSSGYYSEKVLKRDGPNVFKKGTHMYMNHPTEDEDRVRPERDLRDLAGIITSDVVWEDGNSKNTGPGLYADVKVLPTYKDFIDEAAPYIGVSIRAGGTASEGEGEDGKFGYNIESLTHGYSVDYVTMAGRGGEILSLYESARNKIVNVSFNETTGTVVVDDKKVEVYNVDITPEELAQLREAAANAKNLQTSLEETRKALDESNKIQARMREAQIISEAKVIVSNTLASISMPDITRARLNVECVKNLPMTESNELDTTKLVEMVKEAATTEIKYLESVTGSVTGGRVVGITTPQETTINESDLDKELATSFMAIGLNESGSKIATNGRN